MLDWPWLESTSGAGRCSLARASVALPPPNQGLILLLCAALLLSEVVGLFEICVDAKAAQRENRRGKVMVASFCTNALRNYKVRICCKAVHQSSARSTVVLSIKSGSLHRLGASRVLKLHSRLIGRYYAPHAGRRLQQMRVQNNSMCHEQPTCHQPQHRRRDGCLYSFCWPCSAGLADTRNCTDGKYSGPLAMIDWTTDTCHMYSSLLAGLFPDLTMKGNLWEVVMPLPEQSRRGAVSDRDV